MADTDKCLGTLLFSETDNLRANEVLADVMRKCDEEDKNNL